MDHGGEQLDTAGAADGRRSFLKKAGIGVAAAWTAPTLLSTTAHAQGSQNPNIGFVGAGPANSVSGGSSFSASPPLPLTYPAGLQNGDLLIAFISTNPNTSDTLGQDGTWTQRDRRDLGGSNTESYVLTKTYTGGSAATFTRTFSGLVVTAGIFRGVIVAYRDVASVGDVTGSTGGSAASHTFPAVTTTVPNSAVVHFGASAGGNRQWANAASPAFPRANSGNNDRSIVVFDRLIATPGSSGTATLGISPNAAATRHSLVLNALP